MVGSAQYQVPASKFARSRLTSILPKSAMTESKDVKEEAMFRMYTID